MTTTKSQQSFPAPRLERHRSSFPSRMGVGAMVVPLLCFANGCSSSGEEPTRELHPSTTGGGQSSGSSAGGAPPTGDTMSGATPTSATAGGATAGGAIGGGGTAGSAAGDGATGGGATGGDTADGDTGASDTGASASSTGASTGTGDSGASGTGASGTGASGTEGDDTGSTTMDGTNDEGSSGSTDGTGDTDTAGGPGDSLSPGCGTAFQNPPPDGEQQTLEIDGDTRYYLLDVPDNADNETPLMLIFALHGFDMNNIAVVDLFNFTERSNGQAITVWPQGEGPHPGDMPHWGDQVLQSTWTPNEQNYAFLRQVMTDLGERYCIDQQRIFIAGFSMGGFFTNQIACDHGDWFRGFAPVAGGGPQSCGNENVQSAIMVQHGTADDIVELSSGEGSRDFWRDQNGCSSSSSMSLANCEFYDGCAEGKPVAWCTGNYDHYIPEEVASNIWSFFSSL